MLDETQTLDIDYNIELSVSAAFLFTNLTFNTIQNGTFSLNASQANIDNYLGIIGTSTDDLSNVVMNQANTYLEQAYFEFDYFELNPTLLGPTIYLSKY